jgi:cysteine-rich repeat protein
MRPFHGVLALCLPAAAAAAPTFTGDVGADFVGSDVQTFADPNGIDVGVPSALPLGTISGNDIEDVRLSYDPLTDTLFFGIRTYGVATDVDGDGDPNRTSPELAGLGGVDLPDIGGAESFALLLDLDEDGILDVIAGVPNGADASGYVVAQFLGTPVAPAVSFGPPLAAPFQGSLFGAPTAAAPHLEFTLPNFSTLPSSTGAPVGLDFSMGVFLGSLSDAGIGEDFYPGVFQFTPVDLSNCGDGIVDPGEACDDGNTLDGDGCDTTCDVEDGFVCECAGGDRLDLGLVGASGLLGGTTAAFRGVFECPDGEVLYGLEGDFIDNCPGTILTMDLLCGTASLDGTEIVVSPQAPVPGVRPDGGQIDLPTSSYRITCPQDEVVVGLLGESGTTAPFNDIRATGVSQLQLQCAKPTLLNGQLSVGLISPEGTAIAEGNVLPGDTDVTCDADLVATGIGGWGRTLLDGARLVCSEGTGGCGAEPSECRPIQACGDGIVDVGEACDDGNTTSGDGCSATCTLEVCGNGVVDAGEDCDDGNTTDGDGCSAVCADEVCGDGIVQPGEDCDDGNTDDADSCSNSCELNACPAPEKVTWDLDACWSFSSDGTSSDYSDFDPVVLDVCDGTQVTATNLYRQQGQHSCTDDPAGNPGDAMCIGGDYHATHFTPDDDLALRWDVTVDATTSPSVLDGLSFLQKAPHTYVWSQAGFGTNSGPNNPPAKFGLRVLRDGHEIFRQVDVATSEDWEERAFDLSGLPQAAVAAGTTATFSFELLPYDHQGDNWHNGERQTVWDLEDFHVGVTCVESPCGTPDDHGPEICDGLDNDNDGHIDEIYGWRWEWDGHSGWIDDSAGEIHEVSVRYDETDETLTFVAVIEDDAHVDQDGFFLSLSDGPSPNQANGMAAFYFDDTGPDPILTVYAYNAEANTAGHQSWSYGGRDGFGHPGAPDPILSSIANPGAFPVLKDVHANDRVTYTFVVDASLINDHLPLYYSPAEWRGARLDDEIGLWFHPMTDIHSSYDASGYLTSWSYDEWGYLDFAHYHTYQWICPTD